MHKLTDMLQGRNNNTVLKIQQFSQLFLFLNLFLVYLLSINSIFNLSGVH